MSQSEQIGCVEVRWADDGDPDDVVAPWPREMEGTPIMIHVERMNDGDIWMAIYDQTGETDVHMWFRAIKKGVLEWTVRDHAAPHLRVARREE